MLVGIHHGSTSLPPVISGCPDPECPARTPKPVLPSLKVDVWHSGGSAEPWSTTTRSTDTNILKNIVFPICGDQTKPLASRAGLRLKAGHSASQNWALGQGSSTTRPHRSQKLAPAPESAPILLRKSGCQGHKSVRSCPWIPLTGCNITFNSSGL